MLAKSPLECMQCIRIKCAHIVHACEFLALYRGSTGFIGFDQAHQQISQLSSIRQVQSVHCGDTSTHLFRTTSLLQARKYFK